MILYSLIVVVHVLVCLILILVVLLQSGKGADLAGAFGGGATQTAFGSRGPASFLSKVTTGAAIVFMITSITLSGITPGGSSRSVLDSTRQTTAPAPAPKQSAPLTNTKAPTPEEIRKQQEEIEAKQKQSAPAKAPEQPPVPASKVPPAPDKKK